MHAVPFDRLPDDARVWIFAAARPLDDSEAERLLARVDAHLASWRAHGRPVVGSRDWRYGQFLLVGADERASGVSGCSIDALFHALGEMEAELDVALRDASPVWFRDPEGGVRCVSRPEFRGLVRDGDVDADTTVFDNTVTTVDDVRAGRWERPLRQSWHGRVFLKKAASGRE